MMTHPLARAGRIRENAWGRIYSVAGGAPNRPAVVFAANVRWVRNPNTSWPTMTPAGLFFDRGWSKIADHSEVRAYIEEDLLDWRSEPVRGVSRWRMPVLVAVETSQNATLYRDLEDFGRSDEDTAVQAIGYRLRNGDASLEDDNPGNAGRTALVGAGWLVPFFNGKASMSLGDPTPGRVAVSFADFADGDGARMNREDVRSALSAAEKLHARSATANPDAGLSMTADEAAAAAVMVALLAANQRTPPAEWSETPWGWDPYKPVRRGLRGI